MFIGEYSYQLDEKNRFRIPTKLKSGLGTEIVITKGSSNSLFVFNKNYFEQEFLNKLNSVPTFDANAQKALRAFYSSCFEVECDNQGRYLLPASLREHAKISKDVTFIGVGNRIEIWSSTEWKNYNNISDFDSTIAELGKFDI